MPHWRSMSEQKYLGHWDFERDDGTTVDRVLTIKEVRHETVVGEGGRRSQKPVIYFRESKSGRGLVAGAKICKAIESWTGTGDVAKWPGAKVTCYSTTDRGKSGDSVRCVRVRDKPRSQQLAERLEDRQAEPVRESWDDEGVPEDPDKGP